jgi:hypothetical protein
MADTSVSTKAKSQAVTSRTKASRQPSNAPQSTKGGVKPLMEASAEAEKIRDLLSRMIDVTHNWPCKKTNEKGELVMPLPMIANGHVILAFPDGGHVIKNAVTSDGRQNFMVNGILVIPVTSEKGDGSEDESGFHYEDKQ